MNKKDTVIKFLLFLCLLSIFSAVGVFAYGHYQVAQKKVLLGEKIKQLDVLKSEEAALRAKLDEVTEQGRVLSAENETLKGDARRFEEEKSVILTQVRSTVSNFEGFRAEATKEIAKLKGSIEDLNEEKNVLIQQLDEVTTTSGEDRNRLSAEVEALSGKIESAEKKQATLIEQIEARQNEPVIRDTVIMHYNLGNFYFRQKEYTKAVSEYGKAIFYQPNHAASHYNLALIYDDIFADYENAKKHYKKYLELAPEANDFKKVQHRLLDLELRKKIELDDKPRALDKDALKEVPPYEGLEMKTQDKKKR